MRALLVATIASSLFLTACHEKAPQAPPPTKAAELPIEPQSLSHVASSELSKLIISLMPRSGETMIGWDDSADGRVVWITDGYKTTETGEEVREGIARVRVHGRISTVLKKVKQELPWTVSMSSSSNPNLGVSQIVIAPGNNDGGQCFGSLYDNCNFTPEEALGDPMLHAQFICQTDESGLEMYYLLTSKGRASMVADYSRDEGSGGVTTAITLMMPTQPLPFARSKSDPTCAQSVSP